MIERYGSIRHAHPSSFVRQIAHRCSIAHACSTDDIECPRARDATRIIAEVTDDRMTAASRDRIVMSWIPASGLPDTNRPARSDGLFLCALWRIPQTLVRLCLQSVTTIFFSLFFLLF
jgi:hypothetical protein